MRELESAADEGGGGARWATADRRNILT